MAAVADSGRHILTTGKLLLRQNVKNRRCGYGLLVTIIPAQEYQALLTEGYWRSFIIRHIRMHCVWQFLPVTVAGFAEGWVTVRDSSRSGNALLRLDPAE